MNVKFRHMALMLAAMLWISCGGSGDEPGGNPTPQPTERPIVFSGTLSDGDSETHARTRAGEPVPLQYFPTQENGHTSFHVWSYKTKTTDPSLVLDVVMRNYTVNWTLGSAGSTTTNTNEWEYVGQGTNPQTIKYWDFTADKYRFFGYSGTGFTADDSHANAASDPYVELTCPVVAETEATATATSPLFSRLWIKSGADISLSVQPVTLQFIRPVARVRFIFTFVEGVNFGRKELRDIQFGPTSARSIAQNGTVTIKYPLTGAEESWTSEIGNITIPYFEIDYYETPVPAVTPEDTKPATYPNSPQHWNYVLPRIGPIPDNNDQNCQGAFKMSVSVSGNEPTTCAVPAEFMTWAPGHDYTYVFKMTASGSVSLDRVQVALRKWNSKDPIDYPIYNW